VRAAWGEFGYQRRSGDEVRDLIVEVKDARESD
jgi:hypothetical protein